MEVEDDGEVLVLDDGTRWRDRGGDRGVSRLRLAGASEMSDVGRFFLVAVCRADTAVHVEDDPRRTTVGRHRSGRTNYCSRRVTNRGDRR